MNCVARAAFYVHWVFTFRYGKSTGQTTSGQKHPEICFLNFETFSFFCFLHAFGVEPQVSGLWNSFIWLVFHTRNHCRMPNAANAAAAAASQSFFGFIHIHSSCLLSFKSVTYLYDFAKVRKT